MAPTIITIVLATVVTAVVWSAAVGRVPANGMVGIRTQATQQSASTWRAAHRAALRIVLPSSIVIVALSVVTLVAIPSGWNAGTMGLALLGIYTVALIASGAVAQRAARSVLRRVTNI